MRPIVCYIEKRCGFAAGVKYAYSLTGLGLSPVDPTNARIRVDTITEIQGLRIRVREAPEWTRLFQRTKDWTGSDGIYALPLSGREAPGQLIGRQILVFGDTFIGDVDERGARKNYRMVYNTLADLEGGEPDEEQLHFLWGENGDGGDGTFFVPSTAQAQEAGECWYWLQDGFVQNGFFYLMPMLVAKDPEGSPGFKFRDFATCLIKVPLAEDGPEWARHEQIDAPFFHVNEERKLFFGAAFMPNTETAGAPEPDGFVYIYGRYQAVGDNEAKLAVARVESTVFEDWNAWRFWDGETWNSDIAATAELGRGGPELSVTPVGSGPLAGKYLLVSMHVERDLYIRIGDSPAGPFGPRINIYHTCEPDAGQDIYTYNAKAHPSLSSTGKWLVSYNVNSRNWDSLIDHADIYRPRFLLIEVERIAPKPKPKKRK